MSELKTIVFDLDDTLFPERDFVTSGFRAVSAWAERRFDVDASSCCQELLTIQNESRGMVFNAWLIMHSLFDEQTLHEMIEVYRLHQPEINLYPGMGDALKRLRSRYKLGLVSDGHINVQSRKFEALAIQSFFDAVVFSDAFGRDYWKPHPRPYNEVLRRLQYTPCQAIYIGDNPLKDFIGARTVGMLTAWAKWSNGFYSLCVPETSLHDADLRFESIYEMNRWLLP